MERECDAAGDKLEEHRRDWAYRYLYKATIVHLEQKQTNPAEPRRLSRRLAWFVSSPITFILPESYATLHWLRGRSEFCAPDFWEPISDVV